MMVMIRLYSRSVSTPSSRYRKDECLFSLYQSECGLWSQLGRKVKNMRELSVRLLDTIFELWFLFLGNTRFKKNYNYCRKTPQKAISLN